MRLLVVDDERVVLNSIALIIKKENLKFVEMETASTGKEAIERAMQFRPDVIFMDINMPGLNGIDAMKNIARMYPEILFVVVTAYDVFEYAKESLKVGAYDYIVKPFVPRRIVELLNSLHEKILRRRAEQEEILQLRERVTELSEFASDGALELMISNRDVDALICRYERIIPKHGGRIALFYPEDPARGEAALVELRGAFPGIICGSIVKKRAILFIPRGFSMERIERRLRSSLGSCFILACGSEEEMPYIRRSYRNALSVLMYAEQGGGLVEFTEQSALKSTGELYLRVAQCAPEMLRYAIEELFSCIAETGEQTQNINKMAAALLAVTQAMLGGDAVSAQLAEVAEAGFERVLCARGEEELIEASVEFLLKIREIVYHRNDNKYIRAAMEYIDRNYAKEISLESTARYLSVSASTLSRLFRTERNKSFTEILAEKRISKACMMIREGGHSMKEICFSVGYNDPNYFSRIFKKTTGLSPSDYREYGI